jgi:hypothetical protein
VDPISLGVTLLAIYAILQRSPQWAGEAAAEWQAARRGETTPAAADRRQRLIDAGIDPATGGALRQYLGNRWRDHWLDADRKATARRADRLAREADGEVLSWRERMEARADDEVTRRADQWRTRTADDTAPPIRVTPPPPQTSPEAPPLATDERVPPAFTPQPDADENTSWVHDDDTYTLKTEHPLAEEPQQDRGPIRADATVGAPVRDPHTQAAPAAITAGGNMSTIATQVVTGTVSGAAEARAIQRAIEAATAAYVAELAKIRNRIHSLGEQTVGTVQMATYSRVVAHTAQAAESAASAQAKANSVGSEISPLMGLVAREFDRISS